MQKEMLLIIPAKKQPVARMVDSGMMEPIMRGALRSTVVWWGIGEAGSSFVRQPTRPEAIEIGASLCRGLSESSIYAYRVFIRSRRHQGSIP